MLQKTEKIAYFYVGLAILFWGSTAAVGKLLLGGMTNIQLMFYSFQFSIVMLFLIVVCQRKLQLFKEYTKKDYIRMMVMGFIGCYLYYIFFFGALMYAPAQEAFIVNYMWPILVVVFAAIILKEKLTVAKMIGVALGFIGVYVVVTNGNILDLTFANLRADALALSGAIAYGLFSVLGKRYKYEIYTSMLVYYATGFVCVFITTLLFSTVPSLKLSQLVGVAWLGVVTNALAFVCWFKALEYGDTSKMANLIFLTPFVSLVYIYFILNEQILLSSVLGLIFIVLGVFVQTKFWSRKKLQ